MSTSDDLARQFQSHHAQLRAIGYRILGSRSDADDVIQETWFKLSRADVPSITNLGGWLTTVYVRTCLDLLRSKSARREDVREPTDLPEKPLARSESPEAAALLADSIGIGMLIVLDELAPAERVAFVLHDMFDVPFADIAPILAKSADATKMLASRARRKVQGADERAADLTRARDVVDAFLQASRRGDFTTLIKLLHPDAVLEADATAARMGAAAETRGALAVAQTLSGRAQAAQLAVLDGKPGWIWRIGTTNKVAFRFDIADGRVIRIRLEADEDLLRNLEIRIDLFGEDPSGRTPNA